MWAGFATVGYAGVYGIVSKPQILCFFGGMKIPTVWVAIYDKDQTIIFQRILQLLG